MANGILVYECSGKKKRGEEKKRNESNFAKSGLDPIVFANRAPVDSIVSVVERA